MTRAEKYSQIKEFAVEYEALCNKHKCLASDVGIICVEEANDLHYTESCVVTDKIFNNELNSQLNSINIEAKEN